MTKLDAWLKSGEYLPHILRDFHDQKDVFKAMHETINVEEHDYSKKVDWITGQCYVIDVFLWFMARRGYTLQRSRAKQEFVSLSETLRKSEDRHMAALKAMFERESP
ncbi:hypothetical protein [Paraburkholderia tropica]|uniref:hypothetical protein n=1 Tax=Paraburkholderia tropica TaxID=92647 RepID=UPI002AB7B4EC|nr:hypothetical protein [Paraburkholderia tropica]